MDMRDEETEHDFKEGASFDDVIARYNFDRGLRQILFDAIEIIEVALRAKIINHLSQAKNSGLWYLDASLFERSDYYEEFVLDLKYDLLFPYCSDCFCKTCLIKLLEVTPLIIGIIVRGNRQCGLLTVQHAFHQHVIRVESFLGSVEYQL